MDGQSMALDYVRAKRGTQTVFVQYSSSDTVGTIVKKLATILNHESPDAIGLVFKDQPLNKAQTAKDANLNNNDVVYYVFAQGNGWEDVQYPPAVDLS